MLRNDIHSIVALLRGYVHYVYRSLKDWTVFSGKGTNIGFQQLRHGFTCVSDVGEIIHLEQYLQHVIINYVEPRYLGGLYALQR